MIITRFEIGPVGDPYLVRWTLFEAFGVALRLHQFLRPDMDTCPHDHPWWFVSIVLRGGYVEETGHHRRHRQFNRPGRVLWRPAKFAHRIAHLPTGSSWTLVLTGPKSREWDFWSAGQLIPWRRFVNQSPSTRAAWCMSPAELRGPQ